MLGDRVKERRRKLDLTQEELAAASGIKQFHISRIEQGDIKEVKSPTLRKLARALRVSTDFLLEMEQEKTEPSERPPIIPDLVPA